jgi:hypothetical protein
VHVRAKEMKADGFRKPYDPAEHNLFAEMVQGERSRITPTMGGH